MPAGSESKKKHLAWALPLAFLILLILVFLVYAENYSHADETAVSALQADDTVQVAPTDFGWFFDGPSETQALIFYPGAKVEETAYAPLLHRLAQEGMDVFLVKMPFRFAFFGIGKAAAVQKQYAYETWYVGGHSLGGAMAESWASKHVGAVDGVILLGAHSSFRLDKGTAEIVIYGTEDGLCTPEKVEKGRANAPERYYEYVIDGGNHAQFGSYGRQSGDGEAGIPPEKQWDETVRLILKSVSVS